MTIMWLIVWFIENTPQLHQWNAWLVSLIVCGVIELLEVLEKSK